MDLNLLVALDALLTELNVTRAATQLGITQPAMSRALARLRDVFEDPLLVRIGHGMRATPRAVALVPALQRALGDLEQLVAEAPVFDPERSQRTYRLATVDYGTAVMIPALLRRLVAEAPAVSVVVCDVTDDLSSQLEDGRIDLAIAPRRPGSCGLVWRTLLHERFVTVARAGHPELHRNRLTLDQFCRLGHVVVSPQGRPGNPIDDTLAHAGRSRRVVLQVPSFLVAPVTVAGTDLLTTAPERIARQLSGPLRLVAYRPPIDVSGFTLMLGWHERVRADPGHTWFRQLVADVARTV